MHQTPDHTQAPPTIDGPTSRRRALALLGGAGLGLVAAACGASSTASGSGSTTTTAAAAGTATSTTTSLATGTDASCTQTPEETAGPYPGDGSNGPDVLDQDGVVRSDIRSSFGSASGTAEGVPLTLDLQVVDTANGCAPLEGAGIYVWHCDRDGNYSLYNVATADQNYLRGVQQTDADGRVSFTSIYPGCYSGRWPHVHFEVYPNVQDATAAGSKLLTSQLAFPQDTCEQVYATDGYASSASNLKRVSLATDNVFRDGYSLEMAELSGDPDNGYTATLVIAV